MDQKLLLDELALHLTQLDHAHATAIGRQFARRVLLEADQQLLGSGGCERGEELLFEHGEGAFQGFHVLSRCAVVSRGIFKAGGAHLGGQLSQAGGGCRTGFGRHGRGIESHGGGFKMGGDAIQMCIRDSAATGPLFPGERCAETGRPG